MTRFCNVRKSLIHREDSPDMSEKVRGISKWVEIGDFEEALGSVNSKCQNDMVGMGWKRYWCTVTGL